MPFLLGRLKKKSRDVSKMFPYFFFSFRFREVSGSKFKSEVDIQDQIGRFKKNGVECASGLSIGSHHHPYH